MAKKDFNQIVIGGGSAGLVTSYIAAIVGAKVALVEKHRMGGDCLNTGCVPSKALIKSAKMAHATKKAKDYGVSINGESEVDFLKVLDRVHGIIKSIEPHDSVERYTGLGVDCFTDKAHIVSPNEVKIGEKTYTTKNITIATGASPFIPNFKGLEKVKYLCSDNLWELKEKPSSLLVMGGGPIGCELAQAFNRLGVNVTLVERQSSLLGNEDAKAGKIILKNLKKEGVNVLLETEVKEFTSSTEAMFTNGNTLKFSHLLIALGRRANTKGFGLEDLKLEYNKNGTLKVDPYLRTTKYKNIFACGDVAGPFQFTHTASHQSWYVAVNSLFSPFYKKKVNYKTIPRVTFTDPEVASVGKEAHQLETEGVDYMTTYYELKECDRAICESETEGFVKVITKGKTDQILGATIVSPVAGEMLTEITFAMNHNMGLNSIMGTIHPYPTWSEANKGLAGVWKNKTKPEKVIEKLKGFHKFRR